MDAEAAHRLLDELLADLEHVLLDWAELWGEDVTDAEWLIEPVIPAKRSVALFAPGGAGKSLLALWLAAGAATGKAMFGTGRRPIHVLYLDYEMTRADLRERMEDMGYGPESDLKHLHYALLPDLAPLDTREGGDVLVALARKVEAELVVIDTFSKAVAGKENEADTVRGWYQWTGQRLKNAGCGFIRIDHAGKDLERGQRGTSAKNDDVDIVWRMTRLEDDRFRLNAVKRRLPWVPETVELEQVEIDNELGYHWLAGRGGGYPAGTAEVADDLDALGIPVDWGRRKVGTALRDKGLGKRNEIVDAAIKYRRERVERMREKPLENVSPSVPAAISLETGPAEIGDTDETPAGTVPGHVGTRPHGEGGQVGVSHLWDTPGPPPAELPDPGVIG